MRETVRFKKGIHIRRRLEMNGATFNDGTVCFKK